MVEFDNSITFQTRASKEFIKWIHLQMTVCLKPVSTIFKDIIPMAKFEKVLFQKIFPVEKYEFMT